jgi:predicted permease
MSDLIADLRYAVRTLVRSPGFALAAVLALALGIGGNAAIYSVVDALLLEPLPFAGGDRLVMFWDENPREGREFNEVSPAHVRALQQRTDAFSGVAAYDWFGFTLTGDGDPEQLTASVVEQNFFDLLGVSAAAGRTFLPEDDRAGAPPVVLLSHELWRRRFGGDPALVGRTVTLDGGPFTVVGVLPAGFRFEIPADVYTPLAQAESFWELRGRHILRVVGRLAPGVGLPQARAQVATLARSLEREFPETNRDWMISVVPAAEGLFQGPVRPMLVAFLGAVGFVLLIACANVANLLLARGAGRRRELAIRAALGAARTRLVRQLLVEGAVLAFLGAAAGLVLATWALSAIASLAPARILQATPRLAHLAIDGSVLTFTFLLTAATVALFGLVPALRATRTDLRRDVSTEGRATADRTRGRLRGALVGIEVGLAVVLLSGAGLMIRSFMNQVRANPGFRSDRLLTFWTALPGSRYPDGAAVAAFQRRGLDALRALPGVGAAAAANVVPLSGEAPSARFTVRGRAGSGETEPPFASLRLVSDQYFEVLGIQVLRGRPIDATDREGGAPVAVVSQGLADQFFPGREPIGEFVVLEGDSVARQIVGIVADVADWKTGNRSDAYLYLPFQQRRAARMGFLLRTAVAPASLGSAAAGAISGLDPAQPIYDVQPMTDVMAFALYNQRMSAGLLGALAVVALLLAAVGAYGVMAYAVGQRVHEIGVRMALGARADTVVRLVVIQGMRPVAIGLAVGLGGALALSRVLQGLLFEVRATDPLTLAGVAVLLALVALLACYLPARRAARIAPMEALRHE